MLLAPSLGGGGADIIAFNEVIETIATADASTAWCLAQQVASTQAAGYLDAGIAREIFAPPDGAVALGPAGRGQSPRRRGRLSGDRPVALRQRQRALSLVGRP